MIKLWEMQEKIKKIASFVANIEKSVFVNKVGNMITNEKIEFEKSPNDFVNYFDFCMKNEQVKSIDDLLLTKVNNKIKHKERER